LKIINLRNISSVSSEGTDSKGLGVLDTSVLQKGADAYLQLGLIENSIDMKEAVRDDLLPNKTEEKK
jgi:NitT/TauT family transport system substrate-binding protein